MAHPPSTPHPRPLFQRLDIAGRTDVGFKRENNEDQFVIASLHKALRFHDTSLLEKTVFTDEFQIVVDSMLAEPEDPDGTPAE